MTLKRIVFFLVLLFPMLCAAQKNKKGSTKNAAEQVMKSDDPKVIASFIRNNPNDPQVPALRTKLLQVLNVKKDDELPLSHNKSNAKKKHTSKDDKDIPLKTTADSDETAKILTHLFSNDVSIKESFVQITNKSKCDITVVFSGRKKKYTLDVAKNSKNHILIEKGDYMISSTICDAQLATNKNIQKDITMVFDNP